MGATAATTVAVVLLCPAAGFGQTSQTWQVVEYYDADAVGSVRAVTDKDGLVVARHDFLPFGEELAPQTAEKKLFTGQERDFETGQDYFGARQLRTDLGRFLAPDPMSSVPRVVGSQGLNAYAYVRNDPLGLVDPTGLEAEDLEELPFEDGFYMPDDELPDLTAAFSEQTDLQVQQQNQTVQDPVDSAVVGTTTVGGLAKTMSNEDRSLNGGAAGELEKAKAALANALYNNAQLAHPAAVAPSTGTPTAEDAKVLRDVYTARTNGGADPVEGRTQFGTTHNGDVKYRSAGNGLKGAAGRETVFLKFGPFADNWSKRQTWVVIYNNPGK